MSPATAFDPEAALPEQAEDLVADLQLGPLLQAMSAGDPFVLEVARAAVLLGCGTPAEVGYRHEVLRD